jgi:predicted nucleic acid-binding protein
LLYADTSALVKLVLAEPETGALVAYLESAGQLVTSRVGTVELRRVGRRPDADPDRADAVAASLDVIELDPRVEGIAIALDPTLRSLDAVHLATALAIGERLEGVLCYDARLAAAASRAGLSVVAPGVAGA